MLTGAKSSLRSKVVSAALRLTIQIQLYLRKIYEKFIRYRFLVVTSIAAFTAGKYYSNTDEQANLKSQKSKAITQLNAFNDRFNSSVVAGDAADLVDLYAEDTLWIEQGKPATQGLEEPR